MGMLYSTTFLTLDGVMSDPHVWHPAYASDESLRMLGDQIDAADAMLIGRRTYEEFASWWPGQDDSVPLARRTNAMPKLVVTATLDTVEWTNSTIVAGELFGAVKRLAADAQIAVPGSGTLVRALLDAGLLDEMRLYLDPLVVGHGRRLFDDVLPQISLELVQQSALPKGVMYLVYRPTAERAGG
jgi:dihydrofolate reductase